MRVGLWLIGVALMAGVARGAPASITPTEGSVPYDIPSLTDLNADATGESWHGGGFRIEALAPVDGPIVPTTDFDALVRVGWSKLGLHLLITVADDVPHEADEGQDLTTGDCVEVVLDHGDARLRYLVAPGIDPAHARLRTDVDDLRHPLPDHAAAKPDVIAAARKTAAGYALELVIPLAPPNSRPEPNGEYGLQVIVHDADRAGRPHRYAWGPQVEDLRQFEPLPRIRLATAASPPCTAAFTVAYPGLTHALVTLVTSGAADGKRIEVNDGPPLKVLVGDDAETRFPRATGKVARVADRYGAVLSVPLPPLGGVHEPFDVYVASRSVGRFKLRDLDARRRAALANLDLVFHPGVFTGDAFPRCDFGEPARARALIGAEYWFHTDFYDASHQPAAKPGKAGRYGAVVRINGAGDIDLGRRLVTLFRRPDTGDADAPDAGVTFPAAWGVDPAVAREQRAALSEYAGAQFTEGFNREPDAPLLLAALSESKPGDGPLAGRNSIWQRDQQWWYPLKAQLKLPTSYKYFAYAPFRSTRFPLVLFLHGSGERGDDLDTLLANGPPRRRATDKVEYPFILIAPQCPAGEWWSVPQLMNLLDEVTARYVADPDRVYVTGLSMGGYGAWELAAEHPERFAAILPICGAGSPADAGRLKDLPVWIVHGRRDAVVPFARATEMNDALRKIGGRVKFTPYDDAGHDAWTRTYAADDWYKWLLAQRRGHPDQPRAHD